ncbi:hypothetical protein BJ166DRAFT_505652 [Pestalotiopsis sp. NC0098]|nr:hypothetical protein BJ166DRAFT_505652 [Pestalotiopsis sp. NC0098]
MTGTQEGVKGNEGPFPWEHSEGNKEAHQKQTQSKGISEIPFSFSFAPPTKLSTSPSIFGSEGGNTPTDFNFAFSSLSLNGKSGQGNLATAKSTKTLNSASSTQPRQSPIPPGSTPASSTNPIKKTRMSPSGSSGGRPQGTPSRNGNMAATGSKPSQRNMQPEISSSEEDSLSGSDESDEDSEEDDSSQDGQPIVKGLRYNSDLLHRPVNEDALNEIRYSPLFTEPVWEHSKSLTAGSHDAAFTQYALLGANSSDEGGDAGIFYNITAPSSIFICGNQGSGKSHTLSCLLENCVIPSSRLGSLPRPLTGIVFHYDTFFSDLSGTPCEAAHLSSDPRVRVRVLCAPTNVRAMKKIYGRLPNVTVEELRLKEQDLNTKRMLDLMAVGAGTVPLYIHVIQRVLRDMRLQQQATGGSFNYTRFKQLIDAEDLTDQQRVPLDQRLDTLESFMVNSARSGRLRSSASQHSSSMGTEWTPKKGQLTIVDLTCPCVTAEMACSLFNISLSLFLEQKNPSIGRVVALDEAHKYMGDSREAQVLTNSLLSTIRLQRHLALRVIISTQEPSISPRLLDLCSITIVHRFQSPDWLSVLKGHLAALSTTSQILVREQASKDKDESVESPSFEGAKGIAIAPQNPALEMMSKIVKLRTGEALIFAPSAFVGLEKSGGGKAIPTRLDHEVLRVRIRARITHDGGKSIMAA